MKEIKCENNAGQSIIFTYDFTPLHLVSVDGIYKVESNIYMTDNTMIDGSTYQGSTIAKRNIVITAEMKDNYQNNRNLLYKVFKPKEKGTMTYTENDESRQIEYVVEDMEITEKGVVRTATISLLCPDPYFKDLDNIEINMTSWIPMFEWDHEFKDEGEEFSVKDTEQIKDIDTESAADYIGVTQFKRPPIYKYKTTTVFDDTDNKLIEYRNLFYNVYRINADTPNEYYLIDSNRRQQQYGASDRSIAAFGIWVCI